MNKVQARVRYDAEKDGYALEVKSAKEDEWGLDTFYPCFKREGAEDREEAGYVHYGLLAEISRLLSIGYEVTILGSTVKFIGRG